LLETLRGIVSRKPGLARRPACSSHRTFTHLYQRSSPTQARRLFHVTSTAPLVLVSPASFVSTHATPGNARTSASSLLTLSHLYLLRAHAGPGPHHREPHGSLPPLRSSASFFPSISVVPRPPISIILHSLGGWRLPWPPPPSPLPLPSSPYGRCQRRRRRRGEDNKALPPPCVRLRFARGPVPQLPPPAVRPRPRRAVPASGGRAHAPSVRAWELPRGLVLG
jgi:hypothetical protein